jgi:gamma-glutamylcyclotransferase (GGCT)/AIG2-like uncharacterized protein YtfP
MGDARTVHLFSYGTLRQEQVQLSTFGRRLTGFEDSIPGYACSMMEITDPEVLAKSGASFHPIVVRSSDPDAETPGVVFQITEAELSAADAYEVSNYRRVAVRLKSGIEAWVYVRADARRRR